MGGAAALLLFVRRNRRQVQRSLSFVWPAGGAAEARPWPCQPAKWPKGFGARDFRIGVQFPCSFLAIGVRKNARARYSRTPIAKPKKEQSRVLQCILALEGSAGLVQRMQRIFPGKIGSLPEFVARIAAS
jgi:hypothetical protein